MIQDHFSSVAAKYAASRPSYPVSLAAWLASLTPARELAWDCGTGSGQAAVILATAFARVVATDPSAEQLRHAKAHPRVEYRRGAESVSGLAAASCDLVAAAQAAHWFDLPAFYGEADRLLKPRGILAIWGYAPIHVSEAIDPILVWFERERVGRHWPPGRELANAQYRSLPFPYARRQTPAFVMARRWTCDQFLAYVDTWSAVQRCREADRSDPMQELVPVLEPLWGGEARDIRWPLHLLVGAKGESAGGTV